MCYQVLLYCPSTKINVYINIQHIMNRKHIQNGNGINTKTERLHNVSDSPIWLVCHGRVIIIKAAVLQNILKNIGYKYYKIPLQIYIIGVRKNKKLHIFTFFCFENRQLAFLLLKYSYYT